MKRTTWLVVSVLIAATWSYTWWRGQRDLAAPTERARAVAAASEVGPAGSDEDLLVDLVDDASAEQVARLERKYRLKLRFNSRFSRAARLYRGRLGRRVARRLLKKLRAEPLVERAELDIQYSIPPLELKATRFERGSGEAKRPSFPNDPKYKYQWHLDQIGMQGAWAQNQGSGVVVAVIDTGVAYRNFGKRFRQVPDLAETKFVPGYDFVNKRVEALDDHGHGTHVAGTIAQSTNNGIGVAGVAYKAKIMPLKVLSARGFGSVADIAEAVRFAADKGAKVINMSLGGPRGSRILEAAVRYAHEKGVAVVCAAGNDGRGRVGFPAAYRHAIAIAATQYDRATTFYSNYGREIDLAAPGGNTRVDQNNDGMPDGVLQNTIEIGRPERNDYLLFMGTSMASPHAAGVAALVYAAGVNRPDAVRKLLQATASHPQGKQWDPHYGAGIVNADQALRKAKLDWGGGQLGLALVIGLGLLFGLRREGLLGIRPRLGAAIGVLLGACGLFFLPALGLELPGTLSALVSRGLPSWDGALLGAGGHGSPLFFSVLIPFVATALLYGVRRMRGLLFGLAVGVGAHLLFFAAVPTIDIAWIPAAAERLYLAVNGVAACGLAYLIARRSRA